MTQLVTYNFTLNLCALIFSSKNGESGNPHLTGLLDYYENKIR